MILISPYSRQMRNGKDNPKNYPYWKEVVSQLSLEGKKVIQLASENEPPIGANEVKLKLPLRELKNLLEQCDTWAAVDNFWPHFCALSKKPGVVIWGKSDPLIFGYPWNINLLKSRDCLRWNQFDIWESDTFDPKVFFPAYEVIAAIHKILSKKTGSFLA